MSPIVRTSTGRLHNICSVRHASHRKNRSRDIPESVRAEVQRVYLDLLAKAGIDPHGLDGQDVRLAAESVPVEQGAAALECQTVSTFVGDISSPKQKIETQAAAPEPARLGTSTGHKGTLKDDARCDGSYSSAVSSQQKPGHDPDTSPKLNPSLPTDAPPGTPAPVYSRLTMNQLKEMARHAGVTGLASMTKDDLVDLAEMLQLEMPRNKGRGKRSTRGG